LFDPRVSEKARWYSVMFALVAAIIMIVGPLAVWDEVETQRGIDARRLRVSAEVLDYRHERGYRSSRDVYTVVYQSDPPRQVELDLPSGPEVGDVICLEVDAAHPDIARLCDTRGGLPGTVARVPQLM
jgi:hypothetical protein